MPKNIIGRFVIGQCVGDSPVSKSYLARKAGAEKGGSNILLELFHSDLGEEVVSALEKEAKAALDFSHPNVVQLYDFGRADGSCFLVSDYFDGRSLAEFLVETSSRDLQPDAFLLCCIVVNVLDSLAAAHGFVHPVVGNLSPIRHSGLNPHSILISAQGEIKVRGFGLQDSQLRQPTAADLALSRVSYLAPECFDSKGGPASDLFSLGALLWESLTREPIFTRGSVKQIEQEILAKKIPAPSAICSKVPKELDAFVLRLLERQPENRFPSAEDAKFALQKVLFALNSRTGKKELATWYDSLFTGVNFTEEILPVPNLRACGSEHTLSDMTRPNAATRELTRGSIRWVKDFSPSDPEVAEATPVAAEVPVEEPMKETTQATMTTAPKMIADLEPTVRTTIKAEPKTKLIELRSSDPAPASKPVMPKVESRSTHSPSKSNTRIYATAGALSLALLAISGTRMMRQQADTVRPAPLTETTVQPVVKSTEEPAREVASIAPSDLGELVFEGSVLPEKALIDDHPTEIRNGHVHVPMGKKVAVKLSADGYRDLTLTVRVRSQQPLPVKISFEKSAR